MAELFLGLGIPMSLAGIVAAVRLEGRVNGHDKLFEERQLLLDERHSDLKDRLVRIEDKLDMWRGKDEAYAKRVAYTTDPGLYREEL